MSRWDSCSVEENHEGDCFSQATLTFGLAVPVVFGVSKCLFCPCSPLVSSDCWDFCFGGGEGEVVGWF